jgi:hypothetical protein
MLPQPSFPRAFVFANVGPVVRCVAGLWLSLAVAGCSGAGGPGNVDVARQNLQKIGTAYARATTTLNRPPKDVNDLVASLKEQGDTPEILRSPNDGEDYVILWGYDFRHPTPTPGGAQVVLAYEKSGKGGRRYVLQLPSQVTVMTSDELQKAPFPPGHRPPS